MAPKRLDQVIRELREKKGLTQEELAFKARVTPGYVAQLELGSACSAAASAAAATDASCGALLAAHFSPNCGAG